MDAIGDLGDIAKVSALIDDQREKLIADVVTKVIPALATAAQGLLSQAATALFTDEAQGEQWIAAMSQKYQMSISFETGKTVVRIEARS